MKFILNIGLARKGKPNLTADEVMQAVNATLSCAVVSSNQVVSDTEPTLVVSCVGQPRMMTVYAAKVYRVSSTLGQDCIAVYWPEVKSGALIGPNAEAWGEFNPKFFFDADGDRLNQEITMYQGHLADGSSVQKHSAGGLYPFVLYAQETAGGLRWGFISPAGRDSAAKFTYDQVVAAAEAEKAARDFRLAAKRVYNRPGLPHIAVERMAGAIKASAAREDRVLHYVGDPAEVGLFERSPEQQLGDKWSNMRDADFNIGPGRA